MDYLQLHSGAGVPGWLVIGVIAVVAAVLSYQHCNASGHDVIRSNEAGIERAYGLGAEDVKKRMNPDEWCPGRRSLTVVAPHPPVIGLTMASRFQHSGYV